nr:MAG TPA: hypothetical protein [Caudoviricetes sp.]
MSITITCCKAWQDYLRGASDGQFNALHKTYKSLPISC